MRASSIGLGVTLALACAVLPFVAATRELADVDVRTRPNHARRAVFLDAADPVRQAFRAGTDGLDRIDVAFSGPDGGVARGRVELVLFESRDDALRELRRAHADLAGLAPPFEHVPFTFEPIGDSAGRRFVFELRPGAGAAALPAHPWMRARRLPGVREPRGPVAHAATVVEGTFESQWADLSAVALAVRALAPGAVHFELFADEADEEREGSTGPDAAPLRVADADNAVLRRGGSVLLAFDPVPRSRAVRFRWRAELPEGSVLLGGARMPAVTQYHGPERNDERLLAATGTGWPDGTSDLLFRTFGDTAPLALLAERAGARAWVALVLWIATVCLLVVALGRTTRRGTDGDFARDG